MIDGMTGPPIGSKLRQPRTEATVVFFLIKDGQAILYFDEGPHWSFKEVFLYTIFTWKVVGEVTEEERQEIINRYHGRQRSHPHPAEKGQTSR